ncbi:FkbM family methyltransferase [Nitrosospira sp. Nsp13]|uniref:FkbM family methyltransferase n=1 Tax=Nitrosospira sp. Nsp13 TaxID=1855332 RepID=UPI000881CB8B|nr:FkbM family methyltransferase [Nitrosospira sp. Nsp13]SCY24626.1 methyltransferase, FkbM family [Nitrosospira sp. Nsp13]
MTEDAFTVMAHAALKIGIRIPEAQPVRRLYEQQYLCDYLLKWGINCVFDVGANNGKYAHHLRMMGYEGYIFSFEPIQKDYLELSRLSQEDARWKTFNFALGNEHSRKPFNIIEQSGTVFSSFLEPKFQAKKNVEMIEVKRLDSIFPELVSGIENPRVFLKTDTQGYDIEVVQGIGNRIDDIIGLQAELSVTPIYEESPHYTKSLMYFESLGFSLMNLFVVNRGKHGSILEYDCMMTRLERFIA